MQKHKVVFGLALCLLLIGAAFVPAVSATTVSDPRVCTQGFAGNGISIAKVYKPTENSFTVDVAGARGYVWINYGLTKSTMYKSRAIRSQCGKAAITVTMPTSYMNGKYVYYKACDLKGCTAVRGIQLKQVCDPVRNNWCGLWGSGA